MRFVGALVLLAGCATVHSADAPTTHTRACVERVPGEYWASFELPGVPVARWARTGAYHTLPPGAGASQGLDPATPYIRAHVVVFKFGELDVWCGEEPGMLAFVELPLIN